MDTLAINATLPVESSAIQPADSNAEPGEGASFNDALSSLISKHRGKEDETDTADSAPAKRSEDPLAAMDPATGIAAMMVSLDPAVIDAAGSEPGGAQAKTSASVDALALAMNAGANGKSSDPARMVSDPSAGNLLADFGEDSARDARPVLTAMQDVHGNDAGTGTNALSDKGFAAHTLSRPENQTSGAEMRSTAQLPMTDPQAGQNIRQNEGSALKAMASLHDLSKDGQNSARDKPAQAGTAEPSTFQSLISQTGNAFQAGIQHIDSASPDLITPRVGASGWSEAMGQKIVMMASEKVQQAELKLNPEGLGPMQVVLSLENGAANVQFLTHDAQVRESLQSALPRLQEMLNSAGFSLDKVSIDAGTARNQDYQGSSGQFQQQRRGSGQSESETAAMPISRVIVQTQTGRIDTFA
ncbi:MAG: flagellar hook-length control protein FliK [Hydrogenophilaceae bacterium]|nr:flagellar hook-length control protein FliK [Hydrogenophilaceae bacterium]